MSPASIIRFLRKTATLLFYLAIIGATAFLILAVRGVIINQEPARGYHGFGGMSIESEIKGLDIGRELSHQSIFYSRDSLVRVSEKTDHYKIQIKARSPFYIISALLKAIQSIITIVILWHFMQLFRRTDLPNPFNRKTVRQLKMLAMFFILLDGLKIIQYMIFSIFLSKSFGSTSVQQDLLFGTGGNILTGLVIWIIAVIFQRGIELQEENALTV